VWKTRRVNREQALQRLGESQDAWDVLVIGGGATGLGVAVDAASRGLRTALVEQSDFAGATSSRSTKLIHGGFRYLKQGNVSLVRESLRERGLLLRNAPHLVYPLAFVVPAYHWWEKPWYGAGLKVYDAMAGRLGIGASELVGRKEALRLLPTLEPRNLRGGVRYFDGQFDDARLAVALARTVSDHGGVAVNYSRVVRLVKADGRVRGAVVRDGETRRECELRAHAVVNATGIFTDEVRQLDDAHAPRMMTVSQGAHIVLDRSFLPGDTALMVPRTDDGRILFAIPWQGRVLVGTTDMPVNAPESDPRPLAEEIAFLAGHAARYLTKDPVEADILSAWAGLRPLASSGGGDTSKISRNHVLHVSPSGLVTITGGKWTTYRQMAEDTVDRAIAVAGLERRACRTRELPLHGAEQGVVRDSWCVNGADPLAAYGSDRPAVQQLAEERKEWSEHLHPRLPYLAAEVVWAARHEMARTVEDVLSRRLRMLALDARAAQEAAPRVASLLATELGRDGSWQAEQVRRFTEMADACLPRAGGGPAD
jgi:glycerol-3-phosphate dehydrogenase